MGKKAERFASFTEAEKADRDFYKKLTGNERIQVCLELSALNPDQPLERVWCIRKLSDSAASDLKNPLCECNYGFGLA